MNIQIKTRTITEISKKTGNFTISVFSSDCDSPSIFNSQVLEEPKIIDNVDGTEGELMLTSVNDENGELVEGELFITASDADKYQRGGVDDDLLIYVD